MDFAPESRAKRRGSSLATMVVVVMASALLGVAKAAVKTGAHIQSAGRECKQGDIFTGNDFTAATIPTDCVALNLYSEVNGGARIGAEGAAALAAALKENTNRGVRELHLDDNNLGDEGAAAIADALTTTRVFTSVVQKGKPHKVELVVNNRIWKLSMASNSIGDVGAAALADAIIEVNNTALQELWLYGNAISDDGAAAFGEAIKSGQCWLTMLGLAKNEIGDDGATALAEALESNTEMRELYLWENMIGDESAIAFAEALKVNSVMMKMSLAENVIGNAGAAALDGALRTNTQLIELALKYNYNFKDKAVAASIEASLHENVECQKDPAKREEKASRVAREESGVDKALAFLSSVLAEIWELSVFSQVLGVRATPDDAGEREEL